MLCIGHFWSFPIHSCFPMPRQADTHLAKHMLNAALALIYLLPFKVICLAKL